jgi:hypothetical protein
MAVELGVPATLQTEKGVKGTQIRHITPVGDIEASGRWRKVNHLPVVGHLKYTLAELWIVSGVQFGVRHDPLGPVIRPLIVNKKRSGLAGL